MTILADAYGIAFLAAGCGAAIASVAVAILVEAPILCRVWRRSFRSMLRRVIVANAFSGVVGVFPILCGTLTVWSGVDADPWYVHQHFWLIHLRHGLVLFVLTAVVEGLVFWKYDRRDVVRIGGRRLLRGTLLAHAFRYRG